MKRNAKKETASIGIENKINNIINTINEVRANLANFWFINNTSFYILLVKPTALPSILIFSKSEPEYTNGS